MLCNVTFALATEALICVDLGNRIPINKAGYTANTSRGRVSRGGNAHFHTFRFDHYGPTDGRTKPLIELRVRNQKEKSER